MLSSMITVIDVNPLLNQALSSLSTLTKRHLFGSKHTYYLIVLRQYEKDEIWNSRMPRKIYNIHLYYIIASHGKSSRLYERRTTGGSFLYSWLNSTVDSSPDPRGWGAFHWKKSKYASFRRSFRNNVPI